MLVTDNLTGITTKILDEPIEEIEWTESTLPTAEERLEALESAVLELIIGGAV